MRTHVLKPALAALLFIMAFAGSAWALSDNVRNFQFINYQNSDYNLSYDVVREAMKPIYKDLSPDNNPLIGIAEDDLNSDGMPEMISYPLEEEPQYGLYCTQNHMCPHYILQDRGDKIRTLGIIFADSIDRGDNVINGYYTIKAFTKEQAGSNDFVTYFYDKKKDEYMVQPTLNLPPQKAETPKEKQ